MTTNRLRITCKAPQPAYAGGGLHLCGIVPTLADCTITAIADDGSETDIINVSSIKFECVAGECATATITFDNVELDVEVPEGFVEFAVDVPAVESTP